MTRPPETEDVWTGDPRGASDGSFRTVYAGQWWAAEPFRTYLEHDAAVWPHLATAFASPDAAPEGFIGLHADAIAFVAVHHPLSGEIGFWLSPSQRGSGAASGWLEHALRSFPWGSCKLLMAHCPPGDSPSASTLLAAGFREMAIQPERRILCLYRPH